MKKIRTLVLGLTSICALSSCGAGSKIKVNPDKQSYLVGIIQVDDHPALNAATEGFKSKLTSELAARGRTVEFDFKNALGSPDLCGQAVSGFKTKDVDLILANATPPLEAAYNATNTIPILGTSITDYGCALNLAMEGGKSGENVSGTSDLANIGDQIEVMLSLLPSKPSTVGILYCSAEPNSKFQVNEAKKILTAKGITVNERSFSISTDLPNAVNACLADDVVYIPTDNTVAKQTEAVRNVLGPAKKPVFAGEAGICSGCGFATLSIDYTTIGEITGTMAAEILTGEKDIRTYEIQYDKNPQKMYNKAICEELGITVGSEFVEIK